MKTLAVRKLCLESFGIVGIDLECSVPRVEDRYRLSERIGQEPNALQRILGEAPEMRGIEAGRQSMVRPASSVPVAQSIVASRKKAQDVTACILDERTHRIERPNLRRRLKRR